MNSFRYKRRYIIIGFCGIVLIVLGGCSKETGESTRVEICADYTEDLIVEEPESSGGKKNIRLRYSEDIDDKYDIGQSLDEWLESCKCLMPFIDEGKEFHIVRYAFGNCTGFTDYCFDVYTFAGNSKLKNHPVLFNEIQHFNANCLVLLIGDYNKDIYYVEEGSRWNLMVLDYENHKTYVKELDIVYNLTNIPEMSLIDMNNDGKDDIVVISSENNRDQGVAKIFSIENDYILEIKEEHSQTKAYFEDDYHVILENGDVGLKQTVNLTDLCYQEKDLEEKNKLSKGVWKNKMLVKGTEHQLNVSLSERYTLEKVDHNTTRLSFEQWLYWGDKHDKDVLCRIHTTLLYDQSGKCMKIGSVETEWNDNYEENDMMDAMCYLPFSPNKPG